MNTQGDKRHPRPQKGPWLTEIVEGDPFQVAGREVVPLVRVTGRVQRRASLHTGGIGGQGYGLVHMRPVAILDNGEDGHSAQERHQIHNETARAIGGLVLAALLIPWLTKLLIYLWRRLDSRRS